MRTNEVLSFLIGKPEASGCPSPVKACPLSLGVRQPKGKKPLLFFRLAGSRKNADALWSLAQSKSARSKESVFLRSVFCVPVASWLVRVLATLLRFEKGKLQALCYIFKWFNQLEFCCITLCFGKVLIWIKTDSFVFLFPHFSLLHHFILELTCTKNTRLFLLKRWE